MELIRKITRILFRKNRINYSLNNKFSNTQIVASKKKPPYETCRKKKRQPDPDLSTFGGKPFKTCGTAYVIQYDMIPRTSNPERSEDAILRKIEADPSLKDHIADPMPPFQSVEQRLIDLADRGLHPFYKRYLSIPRPIMNTTVENDPTPPPIEQYQCKNEPISIEDLPRQLQINRSLLERKNIYSDQKIIEIPKQMVVRMMEIEKNRKATFEKKYVGGRKIQGSNEGCFKEEDCSKKNTKYII